MVDRNERARRELWDCYVMSGEDTDGGDGRHLNPGDAYRAVTDLRECYDDACNEVCELVSRLDRVKKVLRAFVAEQTKYRPDHSRILRRAVAYELEADLRAAGLDLDNPTEEDPNV